MKALVKRLLERVCGYFVSRFLQPELEVMKAQNARLARDIERLTQLGGITTKPVVKESERGEEDDGSLRLRPVSRSVSITVAERIGFSIEVQNPGASAFNVIVTAKEPFGFGVLATSAVPMPFHVGPEECRRIDWTLVGQRPSEVNLGHPWELEFILRSGSIEHDRVSISVEVSDTGPGRIYYVLTEDCETFDGGERTGDYSAMPALLAMHNRNNFMDPEEYRWQMVEKPDAMNRIAEKYGAKWTHFWCTSQRAAAEWAACQSSTGRWPEVIELLDESIRRGCTRHEYAPHIHFGFEPNSTLLPQPRLLYDEATDGIIPNEFYDPVSNQNHRYHGWDGGCKGHSYVNTLGAFEEEDSKVGSLFRATAFLSRLQRRRRQPHCARAGACDFGVGPDDQTTSSIAYVRNGLVASADAGYNESIGVYPRGRQAYFGEPGDIEREISDLSRAGLVQFKAPDFFLDAVTLDQLTAWFERQWDALLLPGGRVAPGVHAIVTFTHAMVMKGASGRIDDTEGGDFAKLDRHLEDITSRHPELRFGTASEVALEYLDYYTPTLAAVVEPETERAEDDGKTVRFRIRLLGATIPISRERRHLVMVRPPAWLLTESVEGVEVLKDGCVIARHPTIRHPDVPVSFEVDRRSAKYELVVRLRDAVEAVVGDAEIKKAKSVSRPPGEPVTLDGQAKESVFEVPRPRVLEVVTVGSEPRLGDHAKVILPAGLLRLLMNPVAAGSEPLGRGTHPMGGFPFAVAACAAAAACRDPEPLFPRNWRVEYVKVRFRRPMDQHSGAMGSAELVEVRDDYVVADIETFDEVTGQLMLSGSLRLRRKEDGIEGVGLS